MTAIIITIPLPPQATKPNARGHWARRSRYTRYQRRDARYASQHILNQWHLRAPRWQSATVQPTFYFRDNRRRDNDNLVAWLKASFDGLQDAGIVENDSGLTILPPVVQIDRDDPRVELEVVKA